jgi:hypothetical protein
MLKLAFVEKIMSNKMPLILARLQDNPLTVAPVNLWQTLLLFLLAFLHHVHPPGQLPRPAQIICK